MAYNFNAPTLQAPDLKVRQIMLKAQNGQRLSNRELKRIAQRNWVENGGNIDARRANFGRSLIENNPLMRARAAGIESDTRARMLGEYGSEDAARAHIANSLELEKERLRAMRSDNDWNAGRQARYESDQNFRQNEANLMRERFIYGTQRDAISDSQWQRNYDLQRERFKEAQKQNAIDNDFRNRSNELSEQSQYLNNVAKYNAINQAQDAQLAADARAQAQIAYNEAVSDFINTRDENAFLNKAAQLGFAKEGLDYVNRLLYRGNSGFPIFNPYPSQPVNQNTNKADAAAKALGI